MELNRIVYDLGVMPAIRKFPAVSVLVARLVPTISTVTPRRVVCRFLSVTVPVTDPVLCEKAARLDKINRKSAKICFILGIADIEQLSN